MSVVSASIIFSLSRVAAGWVYYHSPMSIVAHFEAHELPRVLNTTGHIVLPPPGKYPPKHIPNSPEEDVRVDYDLLFPFNITLCYGKEWHRFPGNYLVPDAVTVRWIKSEFDGMLPGHFTPTLRSGGLMERLKGTHVIPYGLNDLNKEEPSFYVRHYRNGNLSRRLTYVLFLGQRYCMRLPRRFLFSSPLRIFPSRTGLHAGHGGMGARQMRPLP